MHQSQEVLKVFFVNQCNIIVNRGNYIGCHSGKGHLPQNLLVIYLLFIKYLLPWAAPVFSKEAKVSGMSALGLTCSLIEEL